MKKYLSLVLALMMALSLTTVAWGAEYGVTDGAITVAVAEDGTQTVNGSVDAAPVITGNAAQVITVTTAAGKTANFTIKDLTAKRIVITDSSAVITLEGTNVIGVDGWKPAIHVTSGTLTIKGTGSLSAESTWAAAIGSSQGSSSAPEDMSGTINIEGGTITAKGSYGAAIGAGQYGKMTGSINITDGTVDAKGGHAAAIGGSQNGDVTGTITVSGGDVTATASLGAAIGTGMNGDLTTNAKVNISGGSVSATSDGGAGIGVGGGYVSAGSGTELAGEINISGGDVTATSNNGAGIGAGGGNVDAAATGSTISGTINISAGTVAASSTNGAGIGTGGGNVVSGGSVQTSAPAVTEVTGTINVSGGNVTASSTNANAVGGGSYGNVASSADVSLATGNYSGDVSKYVADNAAAAKVNDSYIVGADSIKAAATTGAKIEMLQGTVTLNNGTTLDSTSGEYTVPQPPVYYPVYTPVVEDTKVVDSAQTFDAGVALYVGMTVAAAIGSVTLGKKRED